MLNLDFAKCKTLKDTLQKAEVIATELILHYKIESYKNTLHTIEALEFYLVIPQILEDDVGTGGASHKRIEQLTSSCFYVHTKSKGENWSLPIFNRHGIDITCGDARKNIYGGILLRHLGGKNHSDGSGKALRVLLRGDAGHKKISRDSSEFGWSEKEKKILCELNGKNIFENDVGIKLVRSDRHDIDKIKIVAAKRVGIEKTKFAELKLRFLVS